MATFDLHDFTIELPGTGWDEYTLNFFSPADGSPLPFISIARAPNVGSEPEKIADVGLGHMRELPGLEVLGRRSVKIGPLPACEVRAVRQGGERPLLQQLLYFNYYETAMCIDVTTDAADAALAEDIQSTVRQGARLRRR